MSHLDWPWFIVPSSQHWLDNDANDVDECALIQELETASDFERGVARIDSAKQKLLAKLKRLAGGDSDTESALELSTATSHPMPAVRWSRRLQDIVRTSLVNPVAVAILTDIVEGLLDYQGLLARREIKPGESPKDFDQCLPGYRPCQQMYRHEWKAVYTTSERKLTEHLVQDETRFAGGEQGMEKEFLRWLGLRGLTSIVKYI
ncbi:hypothetical protein B0H14DRAFT_3491123 [Mycena olivaceomarginata]|nr:hypothetical protein B0H14DRAFT_3491123 [Mycena olivaceomarginata]